MKKYDFLIVGAGLAGRGMGGGLHSIGKKVLVVEKKDHIGGNCYDCYDKNGVFIHRYGPHYFRTNSDEVISYLSMFTEWRLYECRIRACVNGYLYPFPVNRHTLNQFFGIKLKTEEEAKEFLNSKREAIEKPKNAEEQVLAIAGKEIYEAFFKNYTKKQWGISPKDLDASVTSRIPIRTNIDNRYFTDKFQAIPKRGYTAICKKLLKGIDLKLNTNFKKIKNKINYEKIIYTGPIDEFFNYKHGKLPYRSLKFKFKRYNKEFYQDWPQVNYPNECDFTRKIEIKHATGQKIKKTTVVEEYPESGGYPFYPIPNQKNHKLYETYRNETKKLNDVYFIEIGRA